MYKVFIMSIILSLGVADVYAAEDDFAEYNTAINKPADVKVVSVYNAWAGNMEELIKSGHRDGVVIDGLRSYAGGKNCSVGIGVLHIDRNVNVGPIIHKTNINNSTIIIKSSK